MLPTATSETLLHRGAQTAVYLMEADQLRWVEKRLLPFADVRPERMLLAREARLHVLCEGPGIVPLRDANEVARVATLRECRAYLRSYIDGVSLHDFLLGRGRSRVAMTKPWGLACLASLAHIALHLARKRHSNGRCWQVVHRDITPTNVLLDFRGPVWLNDFGLAHLVGWETLHPEQLGQGTPRFMTPEQRGQGPITPATNLYQIALLAFLLDEAERGDKNGDWRQCSPQELAQLARPTLARRYGCAALSACLDEVPGNRPSPAQLIQELKDWSLDPIRVC